MHFSFRFQMHGGSLLDDLTSFCWRKSKTNKIRVMSIMARQNSPNNEGKNFDFFYYQIPYSIFQDNFQFSSERLFIQKTYWDNKSLINNFNFITGFFFCSMYFCYKGSIIRDHIMVHTRIWDGILFILTVVHTLKKKIQFADVFKGKLKFL